VTITDPLDFVGYLILLLLLQNQERLSMEAMAMWLLTITIATWFRIYLSEALEVQNAIDLL